MSSNIFLIIAVVTTGIFVIQFILSIFFGDIDADTDVDADISSVVSFKGLTHFGIGFGWYMYLIGNTDIQSYAIAILIGLFFVFAVWFLYKKAYQLQQVNKTEKTEQLVLNYAKQMGYRQLDQMNQEEKQETVMNGKSLLLVTSHIPMNQHFGVRALDAFQKKICSEGYRVEISVVTEEEMRMNQTPRGMEDDRIDGIVCIEMFDKEYSTFLCETQKPILFIDSAVGIDERFTNLDLILMENQNSISILVHKMIDAGYRRFGFVGDKDHCRSFHERWEACDRVLMKVGISDFEKGSVCALDQENYSDYRWMCERIKELEMLPDVFFCANDEIAVTLIRALREMGLMVPEDIKVVGFDDMPVAALSNPTLTTVRINSDAIGMIAADLLLSRIQNQKLPSRYTYVQTTPVFRESTGILHE